MGKVYKVPPSSQQICACGWPHPGISLLPGLGLFKSVNGAGVMWRGVGGGGGMVSQDSLAIFKAKNRDSVLLALLSREAISGISV